MVGLAGEIVLSRRSIPQPHPYIHDGGDCGACVLGGALGMTVPEVYEKFTTKGITHAGEMARCLRCTITYNLADRMLDIPAEWPDERYLGSFGAPAYLEYLPWFNHIRLAIDAGYYGVVTVDHSGNGGPETDHWVLLCGARTEGCITGKILTGEVLVSCSVDGEKWYEARDFLKRFGGYDVRFVRPK